MDSFISILTIIAFIGLVIFIRWYRSPQQKGKRGEKKVNEILAQLPTDYHILNDVVFSTERGTTQIDHIVVSKYGIFTIETKNYRGKIFGNDNQQEWTQIIVTDVTYAKKWWKTYTYVTKNHLYNPVKQSLGHAYRIRGLLPEYRHLKIVPIVVFAGDAILKDVQSNNHVIHEYDLLDVINNYKSIYLTDEDVLKVVNILQKNNVREVVTNKQHVKNLRAVERERNATIDAGLCPKCGGHLVKRNGKYGSFYGCSNYPKCKFTVQ